MNIEDLKKLPYRHGVGICLFNADGRVLVAERRDCPGAWQMPQGGVQKGEDIAIATLREMKEEIGTDAARIVAKVPEIIRYEFPDWLQSRRMDKGGVFHGKYRGQEQDWFALLFTGKDADIDLSGENEPETPEFINWKWVDLAVTPSLIVPFKKPVYDRVVVEFTRIESALKRGETLGNWQP